MVTLKEINAAKTPKGGWTKAQLAIWGVPWPPVSGWIERLVNGEEFPKEQFVPSPIRPDTTAHDLLRKVVTAVVESGHASDLYDYPDVLDYFGSRVPETHEIADHHPRSTAAR